MGPTLVAASAGPFKFWPYTTMILRSIRSAKKTYYDAGLPFHASHHHALSQPNRAQSVEPTGFRAGGPVPICVGDGPAKKEKCSAAD